MAHHMASRGNLVEAGQIRAATEDRLRLWPMSKRVNKTGAGDDARQTILHQLSCADARPASIFTKRPERIWRSQGRVIPAVAAS
jgi:hypothetical protein